MNEHPRTIEERRQRAREQLLGGDTAGGVAELEALSAAEPDDEETWLDLGMAYAAIERVPEALVALARAVELDGDVVEARLAYARLLVRTGKLDLAAFQLLRAANVDGGDPRVLHELGVVFYDRRLYDKAAHWLERAVLAAPHDARPAYALGLAHEARRDVAAAIAAYREAVRRDPGLIAARRTLADALASTGEHEAAIAELEAVLAIERTNEEVAKNRDVLVHALAEMQRGRLLGKPEKAIEASALVQEGQLRRKGEVPSADEDAVVVRYAAPLVELWATFGRDGAARSLMLVLTDPDRAATEDGAAFRVTVIAGDGRHEPVDFGTAATLTFLREALGCPMTHASELYTRLLKEAPVEWGGARLAFATVPRPDRPAEPRHGVVVSLR